MNEWLTVMTKSPSFTPTVRSEIWRAAVQLETAQAYFEPMQALKASSNSLTFGPCDTQPEDIAFLTAISSLLSKYGFAIGIIQPLPSSSFHQARRQASS